MSLVEQALKRAKEAGKPVPLATVTSAPPAPSSPPPAPLDDAAVAEHVIEPSPDITATLSALRHVAIDFDRLRAAGYLPPSSQERELSEQYRHIKRPLLARAIGRGMARQANGTVIMVSSALQGEGKTFSSINLALSLALEPDASVLLIDADTANPQVSRALGLEDAPGLVDALMDDQVDVEALVNASNVDKLSVLPAGRKAEFATELLGSVRMGRIIERLKSRATNRIVLLDCPPLLITNEAKALVDVVGQAMLVVLADVTPQRAVLDALSLFRDDQYVGLVLNQCDVVPGNGYGPGYHGSYGYGYGDRK